MKEIITEKSTVYKYAWYCGVTSVCFWELPRLTFERVESKGDFISLSWLRFAQHQFCFASLLTGSTWVLLTLELQTGENTTSQGVCAGTTFTPWIFSFIPLFFEIHLRRFSIIYFCNCFFCSNDWNKISKFEREFWSNGKSRLHQGFFWFHLFLLPLNNKEDYHS